jgi:hypothetical protein
MRKYTLVFLIGVLCNSFTNAKTINGFFDGGDDLGVIRTSAAVCPTITVSTTSQTNVKCYGQSTGAVTVTASGGSAPYTYLWSPGGQSAASLAGLAAGSYTVTATDNNSCTGTLTVTITQPTASLTVSTSAVPSPTICTGTSATISATVSGGTTPYTYSWTQGGTTSSITVNPSSSTIYSVSITDANSCAANGAQNITVNTTPTVVATASVSTICPGSSSPLSGSGASTYTWAPSTGLTVTTGNYINASPTVTTTYTVTGTSSGCNSTSTVVVTVNPSPTVVITPPSASICKGSQANLAATGANSYTWSPTTSLNNPSGASVVASPTVTITYTVNGTGANGCSSSTPVVVTVNPIPITPTLGSNSPVCSGNALNLTSTATGATYNWTGPNAFTSASQNPSISNITVAASGTYSLTETSSAGCASAQATIAVTVYATPTVTITSSNPSICPGGNSSLTANGASTYVWTAASSLSNISMGYATATPTVTTTYSVTGTSANGCGSGATTTVKVEVLTINMNTVNVSCNGLTNGNVSATVIGGTPKYTYVWNNGATTQLIYNLPTGTYSVVVKDSIGCKDSSSASITQPSALSVTTSATSTTCGRANGIVTASPTGGIAPYNYSWTTTPAQTGATITGLASGTYSVTLTDGTGCTANFQATVGASNSPIITPFITNSTCGNKNGKAQVVVNGGTPPYRYSWNNGDTLSTDTGMAAATYVITVTDAGGCLTFEPVNVNDATGPTITVSSITNVSCNGGSNGAIALSVTGGAGGYKYKWSNGATTASINSLQSGPYLITVTDAGGCVAVNTINVTEPAVLATNVVTSPAGCGASTGSAAVAVSGGTSPYTYLWNTGASVYNLTNVAAGTYTINVIDKAGCVLTSLASVENATGPLVTLDSVINMNCATKTLGQILITATGGTPPYNYLWSNSATTQNVTGLNAGNYAVTVTDAVGCKGTAGANISTALPTGATICMVTVNPKTNYNTLTWDSINPGKIQEYLIYRQTTTPGVYNVIGHSAGNSGTYIDTLSNAGKRSWWYEISELDSCGQSSPISAGILFKTIHLTATANANGSVGLVWDNFEGATYQRYIIYRDSVPGVIKDSIASVDTNTFGYTDHPPFRTKWYYHVGIGGAFGCSLVPKMSHQAQSINYNASKSNTGNITFSTTGIQTVSSVNSLNVYPNPTRGLFTMSLELDRQQNVQVKIYDALGRSIEEDNYGTQSGKVLKQFDLSAFSKGIYTVQVITGDGVTYRKVVIQ